jgi:hypothetical protein
MALFTQRTDKTEMKQILKENIEMCIQLTAHIFFSHWSELLTVITKSEHGNLSTPQIDEYETEQLRNWVTHMMLQPDGFSDPPGLYDFIMNSILIFLIIQIQSLI